jgi:hypothetical protein
MRCQTHRNSFVKSLTVRMTQFFSLHHDPTSFEKTMNPQAAFLGGKLGVIGAACSARIAEHKARLTSMAARR